MIASLVLASTLALSAQPPEAWVVLVKSDASVPASWADNLQDAARAAAEEARNVRWTAPPQVSLEDAQLALGCPSWGPQCVGQIAVMMKADVALLVEIQERSEGAWLTARLISADGTEVRGKWRYELADRGAQGLKVARVVVRSTILGKEPTVLRVETDVPGAEVRLDGAAVGKTPLTLADEVAPGPHELQLLLEGRAPLTRQVDVRPGEVTRVGAVLSAAPPAPHKPTLGEGPAGADGATGPISPVLAWSVVGAGAAVAAAGGGLYAGHVAHAMSVLPKTTPDERQVDAAKRLAQENQLSLGLYSGAVAAGVVGALVLLTGTGMVAASMLAEPEAPPPTPTPPVLESRAE